MRALEVYSRLSVLRVGQALRIPRNRLIQYKHLAGGEENRQSILQALIEKDIVFIYHQDMMKLVESASNFDAFIAAFTGFLKFKRQTELPPKDLPKSEKWIEFPVKNPNLV